MSAKPKLTPKAAQAITNLRTSQDWATVQEWMADVVSEWNQALIMADFEDKRAVLAGMCRGASLFFESFAKAPQILNEMKENARSNR